MSRRRKSGLSDEDRSLWDRVTRGVEPLNASARSPLAHVAPSAPPPPAPVVRPAGPVARPHAAVPPDFRIGRSAPLSSVADRLHDLAPTPAQRLAEHPLRMDHKTHRRLTRGKLRPDARIDLHGMTLAVAKVELIDFLLWAQGAGHRLVLIITGKGKGDHGPLPTRSGALRHEVPHWLQMAPLSRVVMQVVPAHLRHGGDGAYYVYLRKQG